MKICADTLNSTIPESKLIYINVNRHRDVSIAKVKHSLSDGETILCDTIML